MRKYKEEFKKEAVKLAKEIGVSKASEQLGVAKSTIATWCSKLVGEYNSTKAKIYCTKISNQMSLAQSG